MSRYRIAMAALLLLAPGMALGEPAGSQPLPLSDQFDISGAAPDSCVLSNPSAASGRNAIFEAGGARRARIVLPQLADPGTARSRGAAITIVFPLVCNTAHDISVTTTGQGLARLGVAAVAAGFRDRIAYRLSADWDGAQAAGSSAAAVPVKIAKNSGAAGMLSLTIDVPEGGEPLLAGTYSDSLVIEIHPAN